MHKLKKDRKEAPENLIILGASCLFLFVSIGRLGKSLNKHKARK